MRAGCHRAAALLIVVAFAAVAAGCGGSSAPSRATYGKNVDKICATFDDRVSAVQRKAPTTTDELVAFADELGRVIDEGARKLSAVERPDGDDGVKAQRWIDAFKRQVDEQIKPALAELKDAARRKDTAAIQRVAQRIQKVDEKRVNQLAREAGSRSCGD
jgi:parvulin-like peptidyl-prolyl isomerase